MSAIVPEGSARAYGLEEASRVPDAPQQAATEPGSGSTVPASTEQPVEGKLPFKKQVGAWAHVHRAKVKGNTEEKEHFEKVLAGEIPPPDKSHKD